MSEPRDIDGGDATRGIHEVASGSPEYSGITTIHFNAADGLPISQPNAGGIVLVRPMSENDPPAIS